MNEILSFALIALLLVISPGPNSVLILKTTSSKGKKASIENILGLVSATFLHGAISILGLSALILQSAVLFTMIKYIGAMYLVYLGLKTIVSTFQKHTGSDADKPNYVKKESKSHLNFIEGFLTQILNPKVSMFYLAAFPQFLDFESLNYLDAFTLVALHASFIFFWFVGFSIFVSKIKRLTRDSKVGLWVQRLSGGLLIYFGGLLVTQEAHK